MSDVSIPEAADYYRLQIQFEGRSPVYYNRIHPRELSEVLADTKDKWPEAKLTLLRVLVKVHVSDETWMIT